MDELRAITTFVRAAESGSFNKTAVAQGTTPQAVSKTIRLLEQNLGVRLFHRTTRKSSLTEEGQRLFEAVKSNLDGLTSAINRTRNAARDDEGLIRISAGGAVGRKVLVPLVTEFACKFPGVEFDLLLEDRMTDTVSERIDVGFRAGTAPTAQVIARQLFTIQQIVCSSPEYLNTHGFPASVEDLARYHCTGYRQPGTGRPVLWEFDIAGETVFRTMSPFLCCSDPEAEMLAVASGNGIGQIDSITGAAAIRAGQLIPLFPAYVTQRMGFYIYYAQRVDMPGRVRRFINYAVEKLSDSDRFHLSQSELESFSAAYIDKSKERGRTAKPDTAGLLAAPRKAAAGTAGTMR